MCSYPRTARLPGLTASCQNPLLPHPLSTGVCPGLQGPLLQGQAFLQDTVLAETVKPNPHAPTTWSHGVPLVLCWGVLQSPWRCPWKGDNTKGHAGEKGKSELWNLPALTATLSWAFGGKAPLVPEHPALWPPPPMCFRGEHEHPPQEGAQPRFTGDDTHCDGTVRTDRNDQGDWPAPVCMCFPEARLGSRGSRWPWPLPSFLATQS